MNKALKDKLIRGSSWVLFGKVLLAASGLGINALLARLLTPSEMGAYFLILSMTTVFATVAQLGLTQTIVKLVAESIGVDDYARARLALLWSLRLLTIGVVIVGLILLSGLGLWIVNKVVDFDMSVYVVVLMFGLVFVLSYQQFLGEVFRGLHDIRLATLLGALITSVLSAGMFFWLWLTVGKSSIDQALLFMVGAGLVSVSVSSLVLWRKLESIPHDTDSQLRVKDILSITLPLWITSLLLLVLTQVDIWVLGLFRDSDEVALYGAAVRTVILVGMPLLIVNAVVPPLIAEMYAKKQLENLEFMLRRVTTIAAIPSLLLLISLIVFGHQVLAFFYGDYYSTASAVLIILSVGQMVNVWAGSCGQLLMLTGHQVSMMVITVLCGVFSVIVALGLVEQYGASGVAVAAASGQILQNILMLVVAKKQTGVWTQMGWGFIYAK